jgi:hypothetical protein
LIAYKFLARGAVGPFSGFRWPTGSPGPWVEGRTDGRLACFSGIHGCAVEHLPYWLHDELWEVELEEPITAPHKLVAPRGRLLGRLDAWDADSRSAFGLACVERVRPLAEGAPAEAHELVEAILDDAGGLAHRALPAGAGFCAARLAELVAGTDAYERERAAQAAWLAERLALRRS